jgi:hypothetical protein
MTIKQESRRLGHLRWLLAGLDVCRRLSVRNLGPTEKRELKKKLS